jgi:arsenate reductase-like glutaredoxin family protein
MSGVTNAVQGVAEEDKVGIYEGNIQATSDRFNLLNKSYSNGYKAFAVLYKWGVQEHLKKKKAVSMIGPNGVEVQEVRYKDMKPTEEYLISVSSTASESQTDFREKREKISLMDKYLQSGIVNPKNVFEMEAEIMGFNTADIRRLTDTQNTYRSEIISEASRDIERAISGQKVEPNEIADTAYLQYMADYMRDKKENLTDKQFFAVFDLFEATKPIAVRNMVYSVQDELARLGQPSGELSEVPVEDEEALTEPQGELGQDIPLADVPEEQLVQQEQVDQQLSEEVI